MFSLLFVSVDDKLLCVVRQAFEKKIWSKVYGGRRGIGWIFCGWGRISCDMRTEIWLSIGVWDEILFIDLTVSFVLVWTFTILKILVFPLFREFKDGVLLEKVFLGYEPGMF